MTGPTRATLSEAWSSARHRLAAETGAVGTAVDEAPGSLTPTAALSGDWRPDRVAISGRLARDVDPAGLVAGAPPPATDAASAALSFGPVDLPWGLAAAPRLAARVAREAFPFAPPSDLDPLPDGGAPHRLARGVGSAELGLGLGLGRWRLDAGWTLRPLRPASDAHLDDPLAPYVPGFLAAYRAHALAGSIATALGAGRHPLAVALRGAWASPAGDGARWWTRATGLGALAVSQPFSTGGGDLALDLEVAWTRNDPAQAMLPLSSALLLPGVDPVGGVAPLRVALAVRAAL